MNGTKGNPQTLSCLLKHAREENQEHDGAKILQNKGKVNVVLRTQKKNMLRNEFTTGRETSLEYWHPIMIHEDITFL